MVFFFFFFNEVCCVAWTNCYAVSPLGIRKDFRKIISGLVEELPLLVYIYIYIYKYKERERDETWRVEENLERLLRRPCWSSASCSAGTIFQRLCNSFLEFINTKSYHYSLPPSQKKFKIQSKLTRRIGKEETLTVIVRIALSWIYGYK